MRVCVNEQFLLRRRLIGCSTEIAIVVPPRYPGGRPGSAGARALMMEESAAVKKRASIHLGCAARSEAYGRRLECTSVCGWTGSGKRETHCNVSERTL